MIPEIPVDIYEQWLDTLIKKGIHENREAIATMFDLFPDLKSEKFADPAFQKSVYYACENYFTPYFDKEQKNTDKACRILQDYLAAFPFLEELAKADTKLQTKAVEHAKKEFTSYEHTYTKDRVLVALWQLIQFYEDPLIDDRYKPKYADIKNHMIWLFSYMLEKTEDLDEKDDTIDLSRRIYAVNLKERVYKVAEMVDMKSTMVGNILYDRRKKDDNFNCQLLTYTYFPKENIDKKAIQDTMWGVLLTHIRKASKYDIKNLLYYPFLQEKLNLLASQDTQTDEYATLLAAVREGYLSIVSEGAGWDNKKDVFPELALMNKHFPSLIQTIERQELVQAIYRWLNKLYDGNPREKVTYFLNNFSPSLTNEEIEWYLMTRLDAFGPYAQSIQEFFPSFKGKLSRFYQKQEVKDALVARILVTTDKTILEFLTKVTNTENSSLSEDEKNTIDDKYRDEFIVKMKRSTDSKDRDNDSFSLKKELDRLGEKCYNKERMRDSFRADDGIGLFRDYINTITHKSANYWDMIGISDSVLCPRSVEELKGEIVKAVAKKLFNVGEIHFKESNFIDKAIADQLPEVLEAGLQWLLHLLTPSYHTYDKYTLTTKTAFWRIKIFIEKLPFLKDKRREEDIQAAVWILARNLASRWEGQGYIMLKVIDTAIENNTFNSLVLWE